MRKLIAITACGVLLVLGTACEPETQYNPQSNSKEERTLENCSQAVANILGIHWTSEDGATEKLDTFNRKVKECMNG